MVKKTKKQQKKPTKRIPTTPPKKQKKLPPKKYLNINKQANKQKEALEALNN